MGAYSRWRSRDAAYSPSRLRWMRSASECRRRDLLAPAFICVAPQVGNPHAAWPRGGRTVAPQSSWWRSGRLVHSVWTAGPHERIFDDTLRNPARRFSFVGPLSGLYRDQKRGSVIDNDRRSDCELLLVDRY